MAFSKGIVILITALCLQAGVAGVYPIKENTLKKEILEIPGCVALWDFSEKAGKPRKASGSGTFPLKECNGKVPRVPEGPLSGYSIQLDGSNYLTLDNKSTGALNIYGKNQGLTVLAWVKWTGEQTGFVAGMWNEYAEGGKR
jgi:hypothetical protein